jgi:putative membrane protein
MAKKSKEELKKSLADSKEHLNKFVEWLLYMAGYCLVFIVVTSFFKSIYIDSNHLILWSILIVFIIYVLNKTLKPILVTLSIPIMGLTLGLFYIVINFFILKLVDWMLGPHFQLYNVWIAVFVAFLLSVMNFIVSHLITYILKKIKAKNKEVKNG